MILGVSGSPIPDSNTDRALRVVLDETGLDSEFVKLSDFSVAPCKACLGCVKTNTCVIDDDGILLAEKVKRADALVVAGFTPYSTLDSRTKAFLERLYPLRHNKGFLRGKLGGAVVTSAVPPDHEGLPPACEMGINAIQFFMMEEEMEYLGAVKILGNVPCVRCGFGNTCKMSGITMIHGPEATVDSVGICGFEKQPLAVDAARELGKSISELMKKMGRKS